MVKEKPDSTRCYDTDGFRRRAACVCVRCGISLEVLLVSSSRSRERWVVPGGGIEPNESPSEAAQREVREEAGVRGQVQRFLGVFENPESRNRTTVFLLFVTEELDSWDDVKIGRQRRWFSADEARQNLSLHKPRQSRYLDFLEESRPSIVAASNSSILSSHGISASDLASNAREDEKSNSLLLLSRQE
ncbi:putative Diphosphoinositol polyphosphate phosphohydrolase 1 [Hypsibius exemplaris]|uniref:diphosphoinositol-polyphosphate diphosphatase n=1 Tax=Hypsibius exemplaris TaxID=2072580 RepID=A0A1W0X5Z5_HYPEX|nr:putative Diphosphoinositol polyphosphate phosphohydrolase 1 [Hypsibius exemplaris]